MTMVVNGAVITNKLYVPAKYINKEKLDKHLVTKLYHQQGCAKCPLLEQRHTHECNTCKNFKGEVQLWDRKTVKGKDYITFLPGNIPLLEMLFKIKLKNIDDRRPIKKLPYKLKFIGKLFDGSTVGDRKTCDQGKLVDEWMKTKSGGIVAPPRSGKTVLGAAITCLINTPTIIVVHQKDFLNQFYTTFCGDKRKNKKPMVNIASLRKETGKDIIGILKKPEDALKYDILLITYQSFIKEKTAQKRIKKYLKGRFPLLIVDEAHQSVSPAFAKFVSQLDCKFRLALTATWLRKDGRSQILSHTIGPPVAKAVVSALTPKIKIIETGFRSTYQHRVWVYAMKSLVKDKKRTDLIMRMIFRDYDAGHKSIIIPVDYKAQAFDWCKRINLEASKRNHDFKFADVFHAGCNRKKILAQVDSGKLPVLIAIRSMIKMGIDLASPSMIYVVVPMSAAPTIGAPMFLQLAHRVASYQEGKKQPEIKLFVDGMGASVGCFKSLFFHEIRPKLIKRGEDEPMYAMDKDEYVRAFKIAAARNYVPLNPSGVYWSSKKIMSKLGGNTQQSFFGNDKPKSNSRRAF